MQVVAEESDSIRAFVEDQKSKPMTKRDSLLYCYPTLVNKISLTPCRVSYRYLKQNIHLNPSTYTSNHNCHADKHGAEKECKKHKRSIKEECIHDFEQPQCSASGRSRDHRYNVHVIQEQRIARQVVQCTHNCDLPDLGVLELLSGKGTSIDSGWVV